MLPAHALIVGCRPIATPRKHHLTPPASPLHYLAQAVEEIEQAAQAAGAYGTSTSRFLDAQASCLALFVPPSSRY